jgi:hypothetical protein
LTHAAKTSRPLTVRAVVGSGRDPAVQPAEQVAALGDPPQVGDILCWLGGSNRSYTAP